MHDLNVIIYWNDEKMINEKQQFKEDKNADFRINLLQSTISECLSTMESALEYGIEVIITEQGKRWTEQTGKLEIVVMLDHGEFVRVGSNRKYPIKYATKVIANMSMALLRSLDNLHNNRFDPNTRFSHKQDKKFTGFEN